MSRKSKAVVGASVTALVVVWVLSATLSLGVWALAIYLILKLTGIVG